MQSLNVRKCVHSRPAQMPAPFRCTRATRHIAKSYGSQPSTVHPESYIVLGLANCFEKGEDGKLADRFVIEPMSAAALECLATGARTSFRHVTSTTVADALSKDKTLLPEEFSQASFCDKFEYRVEAAARTWLRSHAQDNLMDLVPLGKLRSNFNFDLTDKRVLNFTNEVTDDDNIKQDISIDVYGRKEKADAEAEEAAAAAAAAAAEEDKKKKKQQEMDDLDALLLA